VCLDDRPPDDARSMAPQSLGGALRTSANSSQHPGGWASGVAYHCCTHAIAAVCLSSGSAFCFADASGHGRQSSVVSHANSWGLFQDNGAAVSSPYCGITAEIVGMSWAVNLGISGCGSAVISQTGCLLGTCRGGRRIKRRLRRAVSANSPCPGTGPYGYCRYWASGIACPPVRRGGTAVKSRTVKSWVFPHGFTDSCCAKNTIRGRNFLRFPAIQHPCLSGGIPPLYCSYGQGQEHGVSGDSLA
jgi:hypothetical protein